MRPRPPKKLVDSFEIEFAPSLDLANFVQQTFLNEESPLFNEDHQHLQQAKIGYLWTNVANQKQMRSVVATAEIPKPSPMASGWEKARYYYQIKQWFKTEKLDFLITLDAKFIKGASHIIFCAVLDHELYHCGQKKDEFGSPLFNRRSGKPVFGLLGHSVEEFTGIIKRYGINAGAGDTVSFVNAAKTKPLIGKADIKGVCGTCRG